MCGIAGYVGQEQAAPVIVDVLDKLTYRGYDSCGIAVIHDNRLQVRKQVGSVGNPNSDWSLPGNIGIGHTRWATHGEVSVVNAHPHVDCSGRIAVVHNGTIDNYLELKRSLIARGHIFRSDTDTEVIAHLLEESELEDILTLLSGSWAILTIGKGDSIAVARRDCPIVVCRVPQGVVISSDENALPSGAMFIPPEGKVVRITGDMLFDGCKTVPVAVPSKGNFGHFMLKEIHEQPDIIRSSAGIDNGNLYSTSIDLLRSDQVVFVASGTSRFASIIGRYIISKATRHIGEVITSSEFQYFAESIHPGTMVVAVSQSGETADILRGVRRAKERGAGVTAITNNPRSLLASLSDRVIPINCGTEMSVAATKSFTAQLVVFYLLCGTMLSRLDDVKQELIQVADSVARTIERNDRVIKELAEVIKLQRDFYYLGRGINFAMAGESALKMKEVSYIHAEGMSAGELKHGTLAMVSDGIPVCGICPADYTFDSSILNLIEVKARKGMIIGISDKKDSVFDWRLEIGKVPSEIYYPVVTAPLVQLLAYWTAVGRGLNPDRPRNLAKSVTVL